MKTKTVLLVASAFFLAMGTIAFAADGAAPASGLSDGSVWKGVLNGCLAGVMAAVLGWLKNRDTKTGEQQGFEIKYMIPTAIIGAIVGIVAALLKKSPTDFVTSIEASPLFAAITLGVEYVFKIVWRHGVLHLRDMLTDIKTGGGNPTPPPPPTP